MMLDDLFKVSCISADGFRYMVQSLNIGRIECFWNAILNVLILFLREFGILADDP